VDTLCQISREEITEIKECEENAQGALKMTERKWSQHNKERDSFKRCLCILCSAVFCSAVFCSVLLCSALLYSALFCCVLIGYYRQIKNEQYSS
jgi:lipopolysaccharide/colanic/teichoic acid biosynthesis glycosyltransferase